MARSFTTDRLISTLARRVGDPTFQRGRRYADDDAVLDLQVDTGECLVVGSVGGGYIYEACAYLDNRGGELTFLEGTCDCPVQTNCKHVVALVLTLIEQVPAGIAALGAPTPSVPTWEAMLDAALDTGDDTRGDAVPFGLQLSVATPSQGRTGMKLGGRLVRPGKTGWVNGELTWSNLPYLYEMNRRHTRVLQDLHGLCQATQPYNYAYVGKTLDLTSAGRQLWPLLDEARDAGVELLYPGKTLGHIPHPGAARVEADVRENTDGLTVAPRITVDGAPGLPTVLGFVGSPAHGVVYLDASATTDLGPDPKVTDLPFRIAGLDTSPTEAMQRLLLTGGTVPVPRSDAPRFSAHYLPRLRRTATVVSSDDSYTAPTVSGPQLRLTVHYRPGHAVDLLWQFVYTVGDTAHPLSLTPQPGESFRDTDRERRILADLDLPLAHHGLAHSLDSRPREHATLRGLDTLRFSTELLPLLRDDDRIEVQIDGVPVEYRDAGDTVSIGVGTTATDSTDWFDLEIVVTVDDRVVPFRDIFAALDAGETHLLLDDGRYLALDKPELRQLRELITEARALGEKDGERLQLSRFQAGLWAELAALGVVRRQAEQWRTQVQGLLEVQSTATTPVPEQLDATLRPYQVDGFRWLTFLRTHGLGGILADDMGLGKTLQSLALISHARSDSPDEPPILIVAPTSVVGNWVSEAARFAPHLRVVAVTETSKKRGVSLDDSIAGADIVVTSYTLLRLDADEYLARPWSMLLLDEAQFVKNHQSKAHQCVRRVDAPVKIAITGTPMENNLMELWSMLSITAPGLFPDPKKFQEMYRRPIESGSAPEMLERLRRRIKPLMLRRTKEQVVADLPAKQEQVLEVDLSPKHRKLYDTHLQRERRKILGLVDDLDRNRFTILQSLTLLRRLSLDASLVDDTHQAVPSAKVDALLEQLDDVIAGGHRALVFSQFTGFLDRVRARLDDAGVEYAYLDGKSRARARIVETFKSGTAPVFLISLKAGGFGLNLTEADYCFLLDPWWNPATEAQAVDRTHRIGQTRNVMVYRLIARDTIEDKVMTLKARKSQLFDAVVDGDGAFGSALTADDIRELLE